MKVKMDESEAVVLSLIANCFKLRVTFTIMVTLVE